MPSIRSSASERYTYIISLILLLGVIMSSYSYYTEKKLVYITIAALSSYQPSFYSKYTKSNIYSSYNIYLIFNTKYVFLTRLANF